jgi:hypothetical protein
MKKALALLTHDRFDAFASVFESIQSQHIAGLPLSDSYDIHIFQDGLRQGESASARAGYKRIEDYIESLPPSASISTFRQANNLGIALHYDFAEKLLFRKKCYDFVVFCEDDLILSRGYMSALDMMAEKFKDDHRVGMISAHPADPTVALSEQKRRRYEYTNMGHNWAYGISRTFWERRQPFIDDYLSLLGARSYRYRPDLVIMNWLAGCGFTPAATSQDYVKSCATYALGAIKLSTFPNFAMPIDTAGFHTFPALFKVMGLDRTQIFDDELNHVDDLDAETYKKLWNSPGHQVGTRNIYLIADPENHSATAFQNNLLAAKYHPSRAQLFAGTIETCVARLVLPPLSYVRRKLKPVLDLCTPKRRGAQPNSER